MASEDRNAAQNPLDEVSVPHPMSKKWIPFVHTNGLAIYHHQNVVDGHDFVGGEYMVSSIVKGSPEQCLAALTHRSSTTTLLGPATAVDVLRNNGDTQVLHIQLQPPVVAGTWASLAAPRHAVVKQTYSKDACGIHCLMFSSLPLQEASDFLQHHQHHHQQQQQRQQSSHGMQEHAQHHHHHRHQAQQQQQWPHPLAQPHSTLRRTAAGIRHSAGLASSSCDRSSSSGSSNKWCLGGRLWSPVLVDVAGGYTVSGLQGCDGQQAPESLVAFILKVDLGGWLSPKSSVTWLYRTAVAAGVVDELRSQMLTAVSLLKDEVEQQRLTNYPFASSQQHSAADIMDSSTAVATAAASTGSASTTVHQQLQQQYHQQQELPTIQSQIHPQHHYSSSSSKSSYQHCVLASGFPVSLLSWLLGWTRLAMPTGVNHQQQHSQQHQACETQQHLPQATPQHPVERTSTSADTRGIDVEVLPRLQSTGSLHNVLEGSSYCSGESVADLAAGAAAADAYEQLVGLDEHGQPITGYCNPSFWSELHQPGGPAPFKVRGPRYLSDRVKVPAGPPAYKLLAVDLVSTPIAVHHIARYLPSVRRCRAASCVVINMMVPTSTDVMNLVMTFGSNHHWKHPDTLNSTSSSRYDFSTGKCNGLSNSNRDGNSGGSDSWSSGFEHALRRFIHASDQERSSMFKMIPHIEVGPWVLKRTAGTTPVIMGRKLQTTYHLTHKYMEVDIDVTTCKTAGYIVQSIRGITTSLAVDLSYLIEGQRPNELPEVLIGAVRFSNIEMSATTPLDTNREVPYWPQPWETCSGSNGHCSDRAAPAAAAAYT